MTVKTILRNEVYLGRMVRNKTGAVSYKEACLIFEDTYPALATEEVWDIVQRVRQNRRRPTKMNEQNKYSGLVVCVDCGANMVLHRAHTMKPA